MLRNVPSPLLLPVLPNLWNKDLYTYLVFSLLQFSYVIPQLWLPYVGEWLLQGREWSADIGWDMGAFG